jgi:hypothetical protein
MAAPPGTGVADGEGAAWQAVTGAATRTTIHSASRRANMASFYRGGGWLQHGQPLGPGGDNLAGVKAGEGQGRLRHRLPQGKRRRDVDGIQRPKRVAQGQRPAILSANR